MYHVHVTVTINAPQEKVFALLSDHERFLRGGGFKCRLVTTGREDRNGVGAVREVIATGSTFTEEVIEFDPPRHYAYIVRTLIGPVGRPTPFTHERGWIDLTPEGGKTRVDWQSRFGMPIPIVGWGLERLAGPRIRGAFVQLLAAAKTNLERGSPAS
jgi:uncharacterized protein YndB with AHSA1/START domain